MQVKRFEAVDMQEAIRLVKQELGPQAIILSTRSVKKGNGAFGLFGRSMVEVTAAVDREEAVDPEPAPPPSHNKESASSLNTLASTAPLQLLQRDVSQVKDLLYQLNKETRFLSSRNFDTFEREFVTLKKMLEILVQHQQSENTPLFSPMLTPLYHRLLNSGLDEALARRLTTKVQNSVDKEKFGDERYVKSYFASVLMKEIPVTGPFHLQPGKQVVAALVGPTGVGKTTTIAKLAAHYAFGEKKKVALLTLDTYRIAAVEQLRIFADIMKLPIEVVLTEAELDRTLALHQDKDLILIDTAGRSQRDELQMAELASFFGEEKRATLHLVLSATASPQNLMETVERFKQLPIATLIFTKLDESNTFGTLLSTAVKAALPLSYLTTGQRVPEDIEIATPERIADLILNISQWSD